MPSLALLLHVIDCVDRRTGGPVSAEAARKAIAWCMYLEAHARRVYQSLTAASVTAATVLAAKLRAREVPTPFRVRTVRLKGWAGLTDGETIELGLELLEELGWVRRVDVKPSVRGGRPTVEYLVNPAVMASIKGSPFPEGFGGFGGGSPQGNPLARAGSTLTESSSSSSSSPPRSDIPPGTNLRNLRNPEPKVERDGATSAVPTLAERARAIQRERAERGHGDEPHEPS